MGTYTGLRKSEEHDLDSNSTLVLTERVARLERGLVAMEKRMFASMERRFAEWQQESRERHERSGSRHSRHERSGSESARSFQRNCPGSTGFHLDHHMVSDSDSDSESSILSSDHPIKKKAKVFTPHFENKTHNCEHLDENTHHSLDERTLPTDMWGAMTFMLVYDFYAWYRPCGSEHRKHDRVAFTRVCGIGFLHCLCLVFQTYLVFIFKQFVVNPEVGNMQMLYKRYHAMAFEPNGQFNHSKWSMDPDYLSLCGSSFGNPKCTTIILWLWVFRMYGEALQVSAFGSMVHTLEPFTSADTCFDVGFFEAQGFLIRKIPFVVKVLVYLFVIVPKTLIAVVVFFSGVTWLMTAQSFEQLIMNALALEFIISIDELFFSYLVPKSYGEMVSNAMFVEHVSNKMPTPRRIIRRWSRSLIYVVAMMFGLSAYFFTFQSILPGFGHDIATNCDFFGYRYQQVCPADQELCLGNTGFCLGSFGADIEHCFPYGVPEDGMSGGASGFLVRGGKRGKR